VVQEQFRDQTQYGPQQYSSTVQGYVDAKHVTQAGIRSMRGVADFWFSWRISETFSMELWP
jgi:hypothetical protein